MTVPVPRAPGQNATMIVEGSPLALIGIFVAFLRERFTTPNNPPNFLWSDDPNHATVLVESAYDAPGNTKRGKKPAVYVDKDQSVYGKSILGDRAEHNFRNRNEGQWCLSTVPMIIDCVAANKGPSAILGDIVHWTLHASSDLIQAAFGLHDMTSPTMGRTIPYEDDREAWTTPISFTIQYNVRWTLVPIDPLLHEIALKIQQSGASSTDYFVNIVAHQVES